MRKTLVATQLKSRSKEAITVDDVLPLAFLRLESGQLLLTDGKPPIWRVGLGFEVRILVSLGRINTQLPLIFLHEIKR